MQASINSRCPILSTATLYRRLREKTEVISDKSRNVVTSIATFVHANTTVFIHYCILPKLLRSCINTL